MPFNRTVYFDHVRASLFGGSMSQQQVEGQEGILFVWEKYLEPRGWDLRHLAYPLATTLHETASAMWPVEELGKGAGLEYGEVDPETGQAYYGRGFVQLTWRENYAKADVELRKLGLDTTSINSSEWYAENQLEPPTAAATMFVGMHQGWFRSDAEGKQTLDRYFSANADDAYNAREIINGDRSKVPSWSHGVSIGNLIAGYHGHFLDALKASAVNAVPPQPMPEPAHVDIAITSTPGVLVSVTVNGETILAAALA
jgi:hypothetical protein